MLGRFGKFTLVERIAEGGMAEVFKATVRGPEGFERIVAIKRLHRAMCEDPDLTQMLVDEARIAVQLNHPNIGNVFDLGCIENQYFIIMEYIDGTDMLHLLEQSRAQGRLIPVQAAVFLMTETLSGLHYAHTKLGRNGQPLAIVHRDVSPQNIMITWDGRVKLVDFGIAKARNRAQTTQHGIIKGKFYYMAPEQAQGHHVDARTDVYAAGMVLYEALAGRSPYDDVPETELLRHVRRADFPPCATFRPDLDPELSALVEVATQRNPDRRFANAMEFQLALNDYRHRKLGAFAEPDMARVIAQIANAQHNDDNFRPMERGAYRPSEESLLFAQPEPEALARAAGGGAIARDRNPFGDDRPTEIYDTERPRLDLPPSPGARRGAAPEARTHGDLPAHNPNFASQRPFQPELPPSPQLQAARARRQTNPSIVDRVAKPKYVYMALGLAVVLLGSLGALWFAGRSTEPEPEALAPAADKPAAAAVATADPAAPKSVAVAFASEPPNAQVFVNDVEKGSTPLSLDLQVGETYRVEFLKDGFQVARQNLEVTDPPAEVTATLVEARGILKILSFPPDAAVFIDDEEQGATPLTLTGMETDQTYEITARLGDDELTRKVVWEGENPVSEVMFEFAKADGAQVKLNVDNLPDKIAAAPKSSPARRTYKRKRPGPRPAAKPVSRDDGGEDLDVFGAAASKSTASADEGGEDLDVFGAAASSKKSAPAAREPEPEEPKGEDNLDVFGSSSSPKKAPTKTTTAKKKSEPKKEAADEDLSIWGDSKKTTKKKTAPKKEKSGDDDELGDIW